LAIIAEVILPLAVKSNFHYLIDESIASQAAMGKRVLVNFGKSKIYTGVIRRISEENQPEKLRNLKKIEEILDESPVLTEIQLQLFEWIAFYYMCTPGEVLKAALPAGLKPESALRIEMTEGLNWENLQLDEKTFLLLEALSIQPVLTFKEVSQIWQILNPVPRLRQLQDKGFIKLYQHVEEAYKPRYKTYYKLKDSYTQEEALRQAFDELTRAPQQENLLMQIVSAFYQDKMLPKTDTLKELQIGTGIAKALIDKGYIEEVPIQVDRLEFYGYQQEVKSISYTPTQQQVIDQITAYHQESPRVPVLLHGITGSGKTHIYIAQIKKYVDQGKQALYLLPEITLTKQIIDKVKAELGHKVGVYHSKFNDQERVEIWLKVLNREYDVIIGVRSSIFLPFRDLGLIVVDEEHDYSFKQYDPAPRYHARDVAIYYSSMLNIPVVLGSATPAFESYTNALQGKYHLITLSERAINARLPELEIVDMRGQRRMGNTQGIFSNRLCEEITERLEREEQIILFQNRRGYSPYLICETCGSVPQCINCDISLTYHKDKQQLRCHYCGYTHYNLSSCEYCGNYTLKKAGIGTEKIEEQVKELFPEASVARMDLDTTRSKMGFHHLIQQFENRQIDILVGTQMVSKGLDFPNVTLVGVINADNLLSFPDFRNDERAYQLLKQVSGRAGRSQKKGKVVIQTLSPENIVLTMLQEPFEQFYKQEIPERKPLAYPPFTRLIRIEVHHRDRKYIEAESLRLLNLLKPSFGKNLLGPEFNLVPRVRNLYRMHFILKVSKKVSSKELRSVIQQHIDQYYEQAPQKSLRILLDVDPI